MATTVMAAHHFIWRHLYASIQTAQTPTSKLRFVTPDKESSVSTLWQEEEFKQICSRESLMEKAADIGKMIVVKERERARYDFDPTMFYENRFWSRRPDGIVMNKYHRTLYILEFKRSSDRNEDFLRVKEDEALEQHRSIIEAQSRSCRLIEMRCRGCVLVWGITFSMLCVACFVQSLAKCHLVLKSIWLLAVKQNKLHDSQRVYNVCIVK
jgi:hypothetical protein